VSILHKIAYEKQAFQLLLLCNKSMLQKQHDLLNFNHNIKVSIIPDLQMYKVSQAAAGQIIFVLRPFSRIECLSGFRHINSYEEIDTIPFMDGNKQLLILSS
jgi:hypothetical protein